MGNRWWRRLMVFVVAVAMAMVMRRRLRRRWGKEVDEVSEQEEER